MVLKSYGRGMLLIGICVLLVACSSSQKQSVIAVSQNSAVGASTMSSSSAKSSYTPTPKAVFSLLDQAREASNRSDWASAFRYLEKAQRIAPDESQVYLAYGETYIKQGQPERASAMFRRVLSLAETGSRAARQARSYLSNL